MPFRSALSRCAATAAAVGLWVALGCASQPQASDLAPCADDAQLQRAVERLNQVRRLQHAPCGASTGSAGSAGSAAQTLAWESRLAESAHEHAMDLALNDRLSHVDSRQRSFGTRLRGVGYAAAGAGENLAAGQRDADDAIAAWLDSPSHCVNLMQPEYRDVGLACVQRRGARYERFWVAHLGAPVRR
jgi:uncharacterized protein YkwD